MSQDKKQAHCTNVNCPARLRESVTHYASREATDIDGLGEKRTEQLIEAGLIERLSDLYDITKDDLIPLERFANKSAQNLIDEIEDSKDQPLDRFIYAIGIPLVGQHVAQILAREYETLDDLMEVSGEELESVNDIGPEVAHSIVTFFENEQNREVIEEIRSAGFAGRRQVEILHALAAAGAAGAGGRGRLDPKDAEALLFLLVDSGEIVRVPPDFFFARDRMEEVAQRVRTYFAENEEMRVGDLKEMIGVSRKQAVPLLEFLDQSRLTMRRGDVRLAGPRLGA
jgi:NAD-dependent DNA ligase